MSDTKDTVQDEPTVDAPATAPADAPAAPQAGADLSVQDLQGLKTIIDVASQLKETPDKLQMSYPMLWQEHN